MAVRDCRPTAAWRSSSAPAAVRHGVRRLVERVDAGEEKLDHVGIDRHRAVARRRRHAVVAVDDPVLVANLEQVHRRQGHEPPCLRAVEPLPARRPVAAAQALERQEVVGVLERVAHGAHDAGRSGRPARRAPAATPNRRAGGERRPMGTRPLGWPAPPGTRPAAHPSALPVRSPPARRFGVAAGARRAGCPDRPASWYCAPPVPEHRRLPAAPAPARPQLVGALAAAQPRVPIAARGPAAGGPAPGWRRVLGRRRPQPAWRRRGATARWRSPMPT